jgi:hypothetical protein
MVGGLIFEKWAAFTGWILWENMGGNNNMVTVLV